MQARARNAAVGGGRRRAISNKISGGTRPRSQERDNMLRIWDEIPLKLSGGNCCRGFTTLTWARRQLINSRVLKFQISFGESIGRLTE